MKEGIHPEYVEALITCSSCNSEVHTHATVPNIRVDLCSNCHPFYTGKQRIVDTAGRVERFNQRRTAGEKAQRAATRKASAAAKNPRVPPPSRRLPSRRLRPEPRLQTAPAKAQTPAGCSPCFSVLLYVARLLIRRATLSFSGRCCVSFHEMIPMTSVISFAWMLLAVVALTMMVDDGAANAAADRPKTNDPKMPTKEPLPPPDYQMTEALTTEIVAGPMWAKTLPVYQVNPGEHGFAKGTFFREFEKHLPVLKEMGVGILWLMPIHPRGLKEPDDPREVKPPSPLAATHNSRSPYSVRDYYAIDAEWGTKDDFRRFVQRAHQLGLYVMLDWVPNHTSWGNDLLRAHPEFYARNEDGQIAFPPPWTDIAQLDFSKRAVWDYSRDVALHWMREFGVDGFRCDVAMRIPIAFWNWLRPQLDAVGPILMLAEANEPRHHPAFDMTYDWELPLAMWAIAAGEKPATAIDEVLLQQARDYPKGAIRLRFLDNHDWHHEANPGNYWDKYEKGLLKKIKGDTVLRRYGGGIEPFSVLCATLPGKPLLYNGQEMGRDKHAPPTAAESRRQSVVWNFYQRLYALYQQHPALYEGDFIKVPSGRDDKIYACVRRKGRGRLLVVLNLSPQRQSFRLRGDALRAHAGAYVEAFTGEKKTLGADEAMWLDAWGYRVYVAASAPANGSN